MPLHPAIVHYPIAMVVTAFVLHLLAIIVRKPALTSAALVVLCMALLAGIGAALTGESEEEALEASPVVEEVMRHHEAWANITLWTLGAGLLGAGYLYLKGKLNPWLLLAILGTLAGFALYTGHLGGELVYMHGAGVSPQIR